jgi:predicted nucleic acid-binding protein
MTSAHVDWAGLEAAVRPDVLVALDTSALLAYLSGGEAASPAAAWLLDARIGAGRNPAVISSLTVAELLVRPFRMGSSTAATVEGFLRLFGEVRIADVTYAVAREAARIRAATGLGMPDALVMATAVEHGAAVLATNDGRWVAAADGAGLPVRMLRLGDFTRA